MNQGIMSHSIDLANLRGLETSMCKGNRIYIYGKCETNVKWMWNIVLYILYPLKTYGLITKLAYLEANQL